MYAQMQILTKTYRLRISQADLNLIAELRKYGIKPTRFIREAFREKVERDRPVILKREQEALERLVCPF